MSISVRSLAHQKSPVAVVRQPAWVRLVARGVIATSLLFGGGRSVFAATGLPIAPVILNEIMYHPPGGADNLQFLELQNPGSNRVDLSGWKLGPGLNFVFPRQTILEPGGYAVICREIAAFRACYGDKVRLAGCFSGKLSRKGRRLELADAQGRLVDALEYGDRAPWPLGADGSGGSLERICPTEPGCDPANWATSRVEPKASIGGTPGRPNSCLSPLPLPAITNVQFRVAQPDAPIPVSVTVADKAGVQSVALGWQVWLEGNPGNWSEVAMSRTSGDAHCGVYAGDIPAQPAGCLIRFIVRVRSVSGAERHCPAPTEPRPTFSCGTFVNTNTARIPFLQLQTLNVVERAPGSRKARAATRHWGKGEPNAHETWGSLAVYLPPGGEPAQVYDHVHIRPRKGGVKVHFHKDQPFAGMTGINIIYEEDAPRWLLSEPLAYDLYRLAGVPVPFTQHVRLWSDGQPLGYYLLVEQPNQTFLRRNGRDPDGDLFKLLWYERGLVAQHEKKTNPQTGHYELLRLIEGLNRTSDAAQWDFIQQHFNVDEMIDYYAVNMCIQNWDGFWNNYYAYQAPPPGGKWEVIPWDEDKTWGYFDGGRRQEWYEMPLDFGMNGVSRGGNGPFGDGPFGGPSWWRPPGHFSGPLLANPEFRQRFLVRLRELCETVFTPERMAPFIDALQNRLEEEVPISANLKGQDPTFAVNQFNANLQSFRNQVIHRREFILKQLASEPGAK